MGESKKMQMTTMGEVFVRALNAATGHSESKIRAVLKAAEAQLPPGSLSGCRATITKEDADRLVEQLCRDKSVIQNWLAEGYAESIQALRKSDRHV